MFPILLLTTGLFWLFTILQVSLFAFWAPDFVFLLIFIWGLYFIELREKTRLSIWILWLPLIFGLGMASFTFFSYWVLAPYFLVTYLLTLLALKKPKWIFRWKEGFLFCAFVFLAFALTIIFIRLQIMHYAVIIDFAVRFILTFVLGILVWAYIVLSKGRGKIR